MQRDIRKLFKEDVQQAKGQMPVGHEARFLQKLDEELPIKKQSSFKRGNNFFLKIAASLLLMLGLSYTIYTQFYKDNDGEEVVNTNAINTSKIESLGDISPDLKKVETYYLANINMELAKMNYTPEHMDLIDGYLKRLEELNKEYDRLNKELSDTGPNIETVDALINNLKLRLNLLQRLKEQLNELNNTNDETTV